MMGNGMEWKASGIGTWVHAGCGMRAQSAVFIHTHALSGVVLHFETELRRRAQIIKPDRELRSRERCR